MPQQTVNLQRKTRKKPSLVKLQKALVTTVIVLSVLLVTCLGGMLIFKQTIVQSANKQKNRIKELQTQVDALKNNEGLYLTLSARLKTILNLRTKQGFIAELPETLYDELSPYGNLTSIQITESQVQIGINTGKAADVDQVIKALYRAIAKLGIEPTITADSTEIDESGDHSLSLTLVYSSDQSTSNIQEPASNGTAENPGI